MSSCWIFNFLLLPNCFSLSTRGQKGQSVTSQVHVILLLLWYIYIFIVWTPNQFFPVSVFTWQVNVSTVIVGFFYFLFWCFMIQLHLWNGDSTPFYYVDCSLWSAYAICLYLPRLLLKGWIYLNETLQKHHNIYMNIDMFKKTKQNKSNSPVVGIEMYMFISSSSCQNEFSNFTVTTVWMHDGMLSIFTVYGNIF